MNHRILITGSSGLVGSALVAQLASRDIDITGLDLAGSDASFGDVRDRERVRRAVADVHGIVHLAAVSRVASSQRDPDRCWTTNVTGLQNVLDAAAVSATRPWVIFVSSREVYGQPDRLPATEDCPLQPVNVYGRSKAEGERLVAEARRNGVRACTLRLSNVYGPASDHLDRVVPAFARAAVAGQELHVRGADHTFDSTHLDDVVRGFLSLMTLLSAGGAAPPPIQLVSGVATTLAALAAMAVRIAGTGSSIRVVLPRSFDVVRFVGDGTRASALVGWSPRISLEMGMTRLVDVLRDPHNGSSIQEVAR